MTRKTRSKLMRTRDTFEALRELARRIDNASGTPTFTADEHDHVADLLAAAERIPGPWLVTTRRDPPWHDTGSWSEHPTLTDAQQTAHAVNGRLWRAHQRAYDPHDELLITVEDGTVQRVEIDGRSVPYTVHDYDVDGSDLDADDVHQDADGNHHIVFQG